MPVTADQTWYRGESYAITDTIVDSVGTVVNITGWAIAFTIKRAFTDAVAIVSKTTAGGTVVLTTPASGILTVTITRADTELLLDDWYVYDVWRTDAGSEAQLSRGTIEVKPTVRG